MARLKLNRRKARRFKYVPDTIKRHDSFDNLPAKGFYVDSQNSDEEIISHFEMENFFRRAGR